MSQSNFITFAAVALIVLIAATLLFVNSQKRKK
jgi:hypothetical protein